MMKQYLLWGVPGPMAFSIDCMKSIILCPVVPSPVQMSRQRQLLLPSPEMARRRLYLVDFWYGPLCWTLLPMYALPICLSALCTSVPHSSRSIMSILRMSAIPKGYGKFQKIRRLSLLIGRRAWYAVVLPLFLVRPILFSASVI